MHSTQSYKTVIPRQSASRSPLGWLQERTQFVRALLSNPAAITACIPPGAGKVLELGCGTGVFTREMLRRGVDPANLVLVEQDMAMSSSLQAQFPEAAVLRVPAQELCRKRHPEMDGIGAAICGLPLRNMSQAHHQQLLAAVFDALPAEGSMALFTYGVRCPISASVLEACGLQASKVGFVPLNLPPASVYSLARRA